MANVLSSILASVLGKVSFKVTSELNGSTLWRNLKIVRVEVDSGSMNSDQPLGIDQYSENQVLQNLVTADINASKIIRPSAIRITALCPDLSTEESIINAFANKKQTLTVTSKGIIAKNMAVTEVIINQTPDILTATKVEIMLEQAADMGASDTAYRPLQPGDSNTLGISIQGPTTVADTVSGLYNKATSAISGIFS
jgi:hypothetical protein